MLEVDAASPDAARARFADRRVVLMAESEVWRWRRARFKKRKRSGEASVAVRQQCARFGYGSVA